MFPSQFHEISAVSPKFETQPTVEVDGPPYFLHHYLDNKLLCRVHVPTHNWSPQRQRCNGQRTEHGHLSRSLRWNSRATQRLASAAAKGRRLHAEVRWHGVEQSV